MDEKMIDYELDLSGISGLSFINLFADTDTNMAMLVCSARAQMQTHA